MNASPRQAAATVRWGSIPPVSEDLEPLAAVEAARVRARDKKVRGPKVIVDNAGLRKTTMALAARRRNDSPKPRQEPNRELPNR